MTIVSAWKELIFEHKLNNHEGPIDGSILHELYKKLYASENIKQYEIFITNHLDPNFFDIDLLAFIKKSRISFTKRDILDFTEDFKDLILNSNLEGRQEIARYYGEQNYQHFTINDIDLSCDINNLYIKSKEMTKFMVELYNLGLFFEYGTKERDKPDMEEINKIKNENETVKFLLKLSPFEGHDDLKIYCSIAVKSHVYKPESILAKIININPIYYQLLFAIFDINQIMGLKQFNEKDFDLLLLSRLDLNIYNKIKDCTDISISDLKKFVLDIPEGIFFGYGPRETNDERFIRILKDQLRDVNVKNYCNYSDIYNNYNFIKRISYRDDLLVEVLVLKMLIGSQTDIHESYIDDMFTEICLIFEKKIEGFPIHHRNIVIIDKNDKDKDTSNPLQKIALALFLFKYNDPDNVLVEEKLRVLDSIRRLCDGNSKIIKKKYIDIPAVIEIIKSYPHVNLYRGPNNQNQTSNNDIYRIGVDVHNNNGVRDKATYEAIVEYIKTCNLSPAELKANFEEFWEYKNILPEDKKQDFLRVLGVDEELISKRYSSGDFGGLLNGTISMFAMGNSYGSYDPKHLLGYFWNFAKTYVDPNSDSDEYLERENIKYGILSGIISALQHDGDNIKTDGKDKYHVVCNPGKLQRIVSSTLNGRFKINGKLVNVDVDQEELKDERQEGTYINNIDEIYDNLKQFFHSLYSNVPKDSEELFLNLFIYIDDLYKKGIYLDPIYTVFVLMTIQRGMDGLEIKPSLSVFSNFDSVISVDLIANLDYIKEDIKKFEEANPHLLEAREKRRLERQNK